MRFLPALRRSAEPAEPQRDQIQYSLDEWITYVNEFVYNGVGYLTQGTYQTMPGQRQEYIGPAYRSLTDLAYKTDSIVFACMQARARHFSQVRFQWRQLNNGRPGKLFGNQDLQPLEEPWQGGTTADLLRRMILHADLGGNAFVVKRGDGLALLRPDWVTIVIGSATDPEVGAWATDAEILGYIYSPGGFGADGYETENYAADEVAHFAPIPDPEARFRGMSWLTPLIREVMADKAATEHKLRFFENPTPNMVIKFDVPNLEEFQSQIAAFKSNHLGARNAYRYMFGTTGMDFTPVGSNLKDLDYKLVTGAGETRVAAAAGVPAVIAQLSEGLQGSSLNAGNYQAARRLFVDGTIRDLWSDAASSLTNIVTVPGGAELWYDDRDVAFVKEDVQERATVVLTKAQAIRFLVDAGYKPDTVIDAVETEDLSLLEHSGLYSVQLQAANAPKQGLFSGVPVPQNQADAAAAEQQGEDPNSPKLSAGGNGNGGGRSLPLEDVLRLIQPGGGDTHVHFDRGAFDVNLPGSPDVHIHEGAIRNEIEPTKVEFADGAFRTEVAAAPTPDVNVTVEAAPAAEPAHVEVNVDLEPVADGLRAIADAKTEAPSIEVTVPERSVSVNVPDQAAPVVNVTTPEVTVNVPDQPAPVVNVNIEDEPLDATVQFRRNPDGSIKSADITENADD